MTESQKKEYSKFKADLKKVGLQVHEIEDDGNCLFRAVAYLLLGDEEKHQEVR